MPVGLAGKYFSGFEIRVEQEKAYHIFANSDSPQTRKFALYNAGDIRMPTNGHVKFETDLVFFNRYYCKSSFPMWLLCWAIQGYVIFVLCGRNRSKLSLMSVCEVEASF